MHKDQKHILIVNVLFWIVAALLHPLSHLVPTESGEPPKFFSFLIPVIFLMLAFASTAMFSKVLRQSDKA